MKTNQLLISLFFAGGIFSMNAQNVASTASLTSGGNNAGTAGTSSVYYGKDAGDAATTTSNNNTFIGHFAGKTVVNSSYNSYLGASSGQNMASGSFNVFVGSNTGTQQTSGNANVYVGHNSGYSGASCASNTFIGNNSGQRTQTGNRNVYIGDSAGNVINPNYNNGVNNTCIGTSAGWNNVGSNNVFIGAYAGSGPNTPQNTVISTSNNLFIDNSATSSPLIWGDFALDQVKLNGKVGVGGVTAFPIAAGGTSLTNYQLFVKGGVLAEEVRVATTWADYVFEDNYVLPTLEEVECFIAENGHLPNVPSAKQVAEEGISLGDIAKVQQEKIEELTLYVIEQKKALKEQQSEIEVLKAQMKVLMEKK